MSTITLDLPTSVKDEVSAAVAAGYYTDEETLITEAVRTLLAARPDIREAIACQLYARGLFSLGKAAEWAGLNIEQMKLALHQRAIERTAAETTEEVAAMASAALRAAARGLT